MKKIQSKTAMRRLTRPYRCRILLLCLISFVQSVLQVGLALITKYVIDAAVFSSDSLVLWSVLLGCDILALILIHSVLGWMTGSTADLMASNLRRDLLRSAVYSGDVRLEGFHSGQLVSRGMEDVNTVCDGMVSALPTVVGQIVRLTMAFVAILIIAPSVAFVLGIAGLVVILVIASIRPRLKKQHKLVRVEDEKVMSAMQENMQHLELIQSLGAQKKILSRFKATLKASLKQRRHRRFVTVGISSLLNTATQLGTGALLLWGAVQVHKGFLTYGALTAMLQLLSQFKIPVLSLSGLWTRLAAVDVAADRLEDLFCDEEEKEKLDIQQVTAIVFDGVTFTYPGDEAPVLKEFSATFPITQWACLTGISGKGKTTLFKLILGLYTPQSGRIYLETAEGQIPCSAKTRHLFAYVPQDFTLLSGTILENLMLVADCNNEHLAEALKIAQAEFVWELSAGENTRIRENNTGLSKGQLQRLAIARAILMERPILLLDECTSALDAVTETALLQALHQMGKQAVLVTHRPESLKELNHVVPVSMEQ